MDFKVLLFVLSCAIGVAVAQLRCYACGFSAVDSDQSCLTITNDTHQVECRFQYCTILRQEYVDPSGVVASFTRGCEQEPDFLNHEVVDSSFRTYYRACTNDLCNIAPATGVGFWVRLGINPKYACQEFFEEGNGVESIVGGVLSPQQQYEGENILVPGTRSSASHVKTFFVMLLLSTFLSYLLK